MIAKYARRLQSAEDRAEIRRRRRFNEEDAMRRRGEHLPTPEERSAAFAIAAERAVVALRNLRLNIEAEVLS